MVSEGVDARIHKMQPVGGYFLLLVNARVG